MGARVCLKLMNEYLVKKNVLSSFVYMPNFRILVHFVRYLKYVHLIIFYIYNYTLLFNVNINYQVLVNIVLGTPLKISHNYFYQSILNFVKNIYHKYSYITYKPMTAKRLD